MSRTEDCITPELIFTTAGWVPSAQAWYWSKDWQAGEKRVDEYIRNGEVEAFDSMDEFLRTLDD